MKHSETPHTHISPQHPTLLRSVAFAGLDMRSSSLTLGPQGGKKLQGRHCTSWLGVIKGDVRHWGGWGAGTRSMGHVWHDSGRVSLESTWCVWTDEEPTTTQEADRKEYRQVASCVFMSFFCGDYDIRPTGYLSELTPTIHITAVDGDRQRDIFFLFVLYILMEIGL